MSEELLQPVGLTLTLAAVVTVILVLLATPLAWWLARSQAKWKEAVGAVVALPLVLPPTVLGFYLLIALGPNGPGGALAGLIGSRTLAFSFVGLVIGSVIYSLPFMVLPLRSAFAGIDDTVLEVADAFGATPLQKFWGVALPLSRPGYVAGAVLTFAHTVGEFGVVLMIGGNVPGQTRLLSVAIYDYVERLEWGKAHLLAAGLVVFALLAITTVTLIDRRFSRLR